MVKNLHLASEAEQLKKRLELSSTTTLPEVSQDHERETSEKSKSAEEYAVLADKFNELTKKFQDLEQQVKYLKRKNNTVMQKNKDMKESVRAWQEYADRQAGKQRPKNDLKNDDEQSRLSAVPQIEDMRPHVPSSPRSVATVRTPLFLADKGRSSPAPIVSLAQPTKGRDDPGITGPHSDRDIQGELRSGSVTPRLGGASRSPEVQRPNTVTSLSFGVSSNRSPDSYVEKHLQSYLNTADPGSSQTTVEESADPSAEHIQPARIADDKDVPEFVSARPVNKRKRGQPSKTGMYRDRSDGTLIKPYTVKEEPGSSPPIFHSPLRKDTIDLDNPTSTLLKTPRHPRHQRSSSAPFSQCINTEDETVAHKVYGEPETPSVDNRAISEPTDSTGGVSDVLRHLDPNTVAEPQGSLSNKRRKVIDPRTLTAHHVFLESGEEPPPTDENKLRLPPRVARARLNRRLNGSMGSPLHSLSVYKPRSPVPAKIKIEQRPTSPQGIIPTTNTPVAKNRLRGPPRDALSIAPSTAATDDRPQWQMKASESRPNLRKPSASLSKAQTHLRAKPLEELKLQDFKVNPSYNQGYTYAFSETVRKRGDRACLPGCTNLQCCGSKFRSFAEARAPLTSSQEEALLEDYLGEAYSNTSLTHMALEERQELVLQARTAKLAKESGKHREAYERRRTPPGFWRVDFPSTQEHQRDREKAKELEKGLVRERRREAQRKGGKWMFRDE